MGFDYRKVDPCDPFPARHHKMMIRIGYKVYLKSRTQDLRGNPPPQMVKNYGEKGDRFHYEGLMITRYLFLSLALFFLMLSITRLKMTDSLYLCTSLSYRALASF